MSSDLTPARLRELLAAATLGPWRQHFVDETLIVTGGQDIASTNVGGTYAEHYERMASDAALIALTPSLAARVIALEAEVARLTAEWDAAEATVGARDRRIAALEIAGKHLAVKLAEVYRAAKANPADCQAMRDWMSIMPARNALEADND